MRVNKKILSSTNVKLGISLLGIIISIGIGFAWFNTLNNALGFMCTILFAASAMYARNTWMKRDDLRVKIVVKEKISESQVNSLNIYPDKILFEDMPKPDGQPWLCENDGKSYYVHIWDEEIKRLKVFALPDQTYYDPIKLANNVLGLPAHRRLIARRQTLLQQLSPAMGALGVIIMWIVIITTI